MVITHSKKLIGTQCIENRGGEWDSRSLCKCAHNPGRYPQFRNWRTNQGKIFTSFPGHFTKEMKFQTAGHERDYPWPHGASLSELFRWPSDSGRKRPTPWRGSDCRPPLSIWNKFKTTTIHNWTGDLTIHPRGFNSCAIDFQVQGGVIQKS